MSFPHRYSNRDTKNYRSSFHYSHKMVNEPLTAGGADQSEVADRYSNQLARAPKSGGVVNCQSPSDRQGVSANDDADAEQDRSPVPNFTVSNRSFGNHRNSMREGRGEGAKQQRANRKAQMPHPLLKRNMFTVIDSASAIPKQTMIKHHPFCLCS